ncbi:FG-GAP repeat domain-containing protein [Rhodohalobacter sp.]|uniref:FG-GAP repeat domain-containing protein n=1 Tax=Rhodohalobacter sp. TaxID=1974210 RepID=UPI002ACD7765|nr:FG-GAP-like repeat-containing protein [Rhodohalobacter sp.]MDZ7756534.1 FG-GAP-like repeat-containing protein [Rhodohalobacter sp.]
MMFDRFLFPAVVLILSLLAGCTSLKPSGDDSTSQSYVKKVNPFPVFDENGERFDFPFLGGFNAPRPQFVDIDNDGYPELFVQENTDDLKFFDHNGWNSENQLTWVTDKFQDLDIGEWFRFVDLDLDGDMDLLTEQPYSYVRYYQNDGSANNPRFELAADTLKDVNGKPIFSDRQNIPNVTDIDSDGHLDLMIGHLDGTVTRYESTGLDENEIPMFKLVTEKFENIEIVKQFGSLHGANTMAFMDIDGDGDQDIFWGDFFEPSILLLENRGTPENPDFRGEPEPFPPNDPVQTSGYNAPTLTPWGEDGNIALFLGVLGGAYNANQTLADNFYFYSRDNTGNFSLQTKRFLSTLDVGNESIVTTGDLNGNGKKDLLLANKIDPGERNSSLVYIYENRGTATAPEFHMNGTLDLPDAYHYAPVLADLDGDGLDDLLLGRWRGGVAYYRNTGDGFELVDETLLELSRGSNATPALADLDGDGDFDLLLGSSGGRVFYYRNEGTPSEPDFQLVDDAFPGVEVQHRSIPAFYDIDGDGDQDLFLGSKVEGIVFFRNTGTPQQPEFSKELLPVSFDVTQFSAPHFADLDGDGVAEFLSGNKEGGVFYFSVE